MVEISDLNLFLGTILDSFMEKGYVSSTPSQDSEVKKVLEGKDLEGKNEGKDLEGKDPGGDLEGKGLKGRKNLEKDLEGKGFEGKDEENDKEKNLEGKDPEGNEGKDFELFKEKAKVFARNNWKRGVALAAGFALGPPIVAGVVGLLGFGSVGIAAGSTAAWMMSLHRGAVAAGSLVSVLQSIGAAGLGLGGVLVSGSLGAAMANAIAKKLETNPKGLEELKKFVTISATVTITGDESIPTKLTFDMHHQLLTNEEVLKTFFHGFDTAKKFAKSKQFEFLVVRDDEACKKGCLALHEHLKKTYGDKYVDILGQEWFVLYLNNR